MTGTCLRLKDGTVLRLALGAGVLTVACQGSYGDGVRWIGDRLPDPAAFWSGAAVPADAFNAVADRLPYWPEPGELLPDFAEPGQARPGAPSRAEWLAMVGEMGGAA